MYDQIVRCIIAYKRRKAECSWKTDLRSKSPNCRLRAKITDDDSSDILEPGDVVLRAKHKVDSAMVQDKVLS